MPILIRGSGGAKAKLQEKIITPTTAQQIILPDTGYDGFSKVTVNKVNLEYNKSVMDISGYRATTPSNGYIGLSSARAYPVFDTYSCELTVSSDKKTLTVSLDSGYTNYYNIRQVVFVAIYGSDSDFDNDYVYGMAITKRGDDAVYKCRCVAHGKGASGNITDAKVEVSCDTTNNKFTVTIKSTWKWANAANYYGQVLYCT